MKPFNIKLITTVILLFAFVFSNAQDPNRFKDQVDELAGKEYNFSNDKKLVVFTGSSSIRMWKDVHDYFPEYNVVNNGFGGSQFSDLLFFNKQLILKSNPDILFIYEGDNDINDNKKPSKILKEAKQLVAITHTDLPNTRIVFISPKPSIARAHLKNKYITFNNKLERYSNRTKNTDFVNVWAPMLDKQGNVFKDIFLED